MSSAITAAHTTDTQAVCDLSRLSVTNTPFPHATHREFIAASAYRELRDSFPDCPPGSGPTGFSLFWGDEGYARLLETSLTWRALFDTFQSQAFIDWGVQQFAEVWERAGCQLDLSKARYISYCEDRIDKERPRLRRVEHQPQELWVRMDIHQGRIGYDRMIHVDHARRLISMLIYLCDQDENHLEGGELFLHNGASSPPETRITPRHNLMVAFPCTARSYHSVSRITAMATPRNYLQVHISSSVDIWPREIASSPLRMRIKSLQRRLGWE